MGAGLDLLYPNELLIEYRKKHRSPGVESYPTPGEWAMGYLRILNEFDFKLTDHLSLLLMFEKLIVGGRCC